jgi:hypothetical protein
LRRAHPTLDGIQQRRWERIRIKVMRIADMFCKYAPSFSVYIIIHLVSHCSFIYLSIYLFDLFYGHQNLKYIQGVSKWLQTLKVFGNSIKSTRLSQCPNENACLGTLPCKPKIFNRLEPNGHYSGRTAQLTSRLCI